MEQIFKAGGNKEDIIKASKKGQPLMMFISVAGTPTRKDTERISSLWQSSLQNNNIQVQRYLENKQASGLRYIFYCGVAISLAYESSNVLKFRKIYRIKPSFADKNHTKF